LVQLSRGDGVDAFDPGCDLAIGDALNFQRMQVAESGDLVKGQRGVVDQPNGRRFRHQYFGHLYDS